MRVCVLGAGAIGGFIGTRLAAAGVATSALARGATLAALQTHGWRAETGGELVTAPVRATADPAELGRQDVVVLAVKAQAARSAAAVIGPLLGPQTMVLTAMNGVPWWFFDGFGGPCQGRHLDSVDPGGTIAAAIGVQHVIGAVVHLSSSVPEPGLVRHHHGAALIIGEPGHQDSARVQALAELLRAGSLDVTVSRSIHTDVWYKLWGNMTINPVSVLTNATADRIMDDDLVREFCQAAMREAQQIGARIGCPIAETPDDRNKITRKLGAFTTSMLQDARAGRSLELDALVGAVREIGVTVGVPTPAVDALYGLARLWARCH
ncbi:MAG TPA: 2-dehydropantoate 2-reductase [Streptosporangiaceae bacterium]|jgi:2-dehydropantoate 2-reductase|nr:2-dehydropantoate 2-reductase [Streptosporangiaceae bacterium]